MSDAGIVRNRLKIAATISNARAFLAVQKEFGTFDSVYLGICAAKTERTQRPAATGERNADA